MTTELAQWIIGAAASCTVAVLCAVAWLTVLVFRIGQKYGAVENQLETIHKAGERFDHANERLERVAVIEAKVDQLIDSHAEERRRISSEFPEIKGKVTALWGSVFPNENWRKSQGEYGE